MGYNFVNISEISLNNFSFEFFSEYVNYYYPVITPEVISEAWELFLLQDTKIVTNLILEILNLSAVRAPALLHSEKSNSAIEPLQYSVYLLDHTKTFSEHFEYYFSRILSAEKFQEILFLKLDSEDEEDQFETYAGELANEIIARVKYLNSTGNNAILAEIALKLFDSKEQAQLQQKGIDLKEVCLKSESGPIISRLRIEWINKYDFQIVLPDYGNLVVEMTLLPKALYYFFLKHPEGVKLKYMADYKDELFDIYSRLSNKSDLDVIREHIERLTNPTDNSMHVNFSRIKNAFVKLFDDELAKNYYITGHRGSPKKIVLNRNMVEIVELF